MATTFSQEFSDFAQFLFADPFLFEETGQEQFRRAVTDAPVSIMIHADDGEVVRINDLWTELTGYAHSDMPTISEWTSKAYGQRMGDVR